MPHKSKAASFDPTFGEGGIKYFTFESELKTEVTAIALTADNEIYVTGNLHDARPFQPTLFWLTRLNSTGVVNEDFAKHSSTPGFVIDAFEPFIAGRRSLARRLTVLNNTDILVTGVDSGYYTGLARYLRSGSPNFVFGTSGKVVLKEIAQPEIGSSLQGSQRAIELSNGQIVVSSTSLLPTNNTVGVIYRLNVDGSLDKTLKGQGYFRVERADAPGNWVTLNDLLIEPDGKLIAFGTDIEAGMKVEQLIFARYSSEGDLDTSYGDEGFLLVDGVGFPTAHQLVKHKDDRLIGIGRSADNPRCGLFVGVTKNGSMDNQFNNGEPLLLLLNNENTTLERGVLDGNGNLIIAGYGFDESVGRFTAAVGRLLPDGTLDQSFNDQGWEHLSIGVGDSAVTAVALQQDGKLLIAGHSEGGVYIARLII